MIYDDTARKELIHRFWSVQRKSTAHQYSTSTFNLVKSLDKKSRVLKIHLEEALEWIQSIDTILKGLI